MFRPSSLLCNFLSLVSVNYFTPSAAEATATAAATPNSGTPTPATTSTPTAATTSVSLTLQLSQQAGDVPDANEPLLGLYHLQVVDAAGRVVAGIHLLSPLELRLHLRSGEVSELGLDPRTLAVSFPDLITAARQAHHATNGLVVPLSANADDTTLSAQVSTLEASSMALGGTSGGAGSSATQNPPTPLLANEQGGSGQLGLRYPFSLAPNAAGVVLFEELIFRISTIKFRCTSPFLA
jgi:hypothetical protein